MDKQAFTIVSRTFAMIFRILFAVFSKDDWFDVQGFLVKFSHVFPGFTAWLNNFEKSQNAVNSRVALRQGVHVLKAEVFCGLETSKCVSFACIRQLTTI